MAVGNNPTQHARAANEHSAMLGATHRSFLRNSLVPLCLTGSLSNPTSSRAQIGLGGHLRTQCTNRLTTATAASTTASTTTVPDLTTVAPNPRAPPLLITATSISATITAATTDKTTFITSTTDRKTPDVPSTTNTITIPTFGDVGPVTTCPGYDRTFTLRNGLVGHLRLHRIVTGSSGCKHLTYTRLLCRQCICSMTHRSGLFDHMRTHKSGARRAIDTTNTRCIPNNVTISGN
nr:unnamed protein product [Spirometra erinaceieuropaei]